MKRRNLLASLLALALSPAASAQVHTYSRPRKGIAPRVDLTVPPAPRGAVLLIHGGGFVTGSRRMASIRGCAAAANAAGFASLALDYRLLARGGRFDEALDDVLACMAWWRAVAPEHGVPPDRLALWGLSAGAALAGIAATEGRAQAWIGAYGPYDLRRLPGFGAGTLPTRMLLGTVDPAALLARSPLARATAPIPTLLFHGTRDSLVPIAHAESLVAARRAAGLPVTLRAVEAGHGYLKHGDSPATRATLTEACAFLQANLGGSLPPPV